MAGESKLKQCSLYLVRYVPDVVRDESLNIGLFLHSPEDEYLDCLFTDDFRRVKRFHQRADLELLGELQEHFEREITEHEENFERYLKEIHETYSNLIQLSDPRPCLLSDPQSEMPQLFSRYVGERRAGPLPQDTRMRIKQQLRNALKRAGVLEHSNFEKRVPAEAWTQKGDPFAFDFGYRPRESEGKLNGHLKLIHALSLRRDPQIADVLAVKITQVRRKERAELTAVVDALPGPGDETANYSKGVLDEHRITPLPLSEVAEFAESIRRELMV